MSLVPQKSKTNIEKTTVFEEISVFSSDRFWTLIWDPPGLIFGGHLAPRHAETGLLGALGPSKSRSKPSFSLLQEPLRALQEASKSAPYAPGSSPLAYQALLVFKAPISLQDVYKRPPGPMWQPCWNHFEAIMQPIRSDVPPPHIGHLKRALNPRAFKRLSDRVRVEDAIEGAV